MSSNLNLRTRVQGTKIRIIIERKSASTATETMTEYAKLAKRMIETHGFNLILEVKWKFTLSGFLMSTEMEIHQSCSVKMTIAPTALRSGLVIPSAMVSDDCDRNRVCYASGKR